MAPLSLTNKKLLRTSQKFYVAPIGLEPMTLRV